MDQPAARPPSNPKRTSARSSRPFRTRWSSSTRGLDPFVQRGRRKDVRLFREPRSLGKNVKMLMPFPDRDRHDGISATIVTTGERKIIGIGRVTTALHRDGNTFPIELVRRRSMERRKRIFTGFIRDLTERQQTLLRLQELQSELAHVGRVSEMGTLASSLAHELNQPLTAVASYCEGARDLLAGELDDETLAMVREAMDEAAAAGDPRRPDRPAPARLHEPRRDRARIENLPAPDRRKPMRSRWSARASMESMSKFSSIPTPIWSSSTASRFNRCSST